MASAHLPRWFFMVGTVVLIMMSMGIGQLKAESMNSSEGLLQPMMPLKLRKLATAGRGLCQTLVLPVGGYPCTEHTVQTEDGFLLGVQNLPHGVKGRGDKPRTPVFLQHGLIGGGESWLFNSPSESLSFILADAGYDVWIGNVRGVEWSHGHISYAPTNPAFWAWSWDEMAALDLPAMLEFVYKRTGSKILFVGYSQGTSLYMAGLSSTPKAAAMKNQLAAAVLLCPIAELRHITSGFIIAASKIYADKIWNHIGPAEFNVHNKDEAKFVNELCHVPSINCGNLFDAFTGNSCCLDGSLISHYLEYFPQPTSSQNMFHFTQMVRSGQFQKYDFGSAAANMAHYSQSTPPIYDVTKLPASVPIMIMQGSSDQLADPVDVKALVAKLSTQLKKVVLVPNYGHGDFIASTTANVDVYSHITDFFHTLRI